MSHTMPAAPWQGRHVVFFSWRDTANPEGGGAEVYLEHVARGLRDRGARVTIFCAAHGLAPVEETREGIRFVRRGSKLAVYARGLLLLVARRFGRVDAIVDVQNGMPFLTRLVTRTPVVVLVHHVHREQWPVVYPGLVGRIGWWVESRLAPWVYRRDQYVAVSQATRAELVTLGVDRSRIAVVHNGTDPADPVDVARDPAPRMCTVGRLVPHKQVEHAIEACVQLRQEVPGLRLSVVGAGWWEEELRRHVHRLGAQDYVELVGHVDGRRLQEVYAQSWLMALPSLKEGWGLVVGEAGMHGTPTVAYAAAGGTRESIEDGVSGLLAEDRQEFVAQLRAVLTDDDLRQRLADGARAMSHRFTWQHAEESFARVVASACEGRVESGQDPRGASVSSRRRGRPAR